MLAVLDRSLGGYEHYGQLVLGARLQNLPNPSLPEFAGSSPRCSKSISSSLASDSEKQLCQLIISVCRPRSLISCQTAGGCFTLLRDCDT